MKMLIKFRRSVRIEKSKWQVDQKYVEIELSFILFNFVVSITWKLETKTNTLRYEYIRMEGRIDGVEKSLVW